VPLDSAFLIAVRGIGCVNFVAAANPPQVLVGGDCVIQRKSEVPRDAEDILDANILQPDRTCSMTDLLKSLLLRFREI